MGCGRVSLSGFLAGFGREEFLFSVSEMGREVNGPENGNGKWNVKAQFMNFQPFWQRTGCGELLPTGPEPRRSIRWGAGQCGAARGMSKAGWNQVCVSGILEEKRGIRAREDGN